MKYRVIQWATGHVGKHALRAIAQHPELELVGLWVSGAEKAGKDAGELCGVGRVGVQATVEQFEVVSDQQHHARGDEDEKTGADSRQRYDTQCHRGAEADDQLHLVADLAVTLMPAFERHGIVGAGEVGVTDGAAARCLQADDHAREGGFAADGFADDSEGGAAADAKGDAVYGANDAARRPTPPLPARAGPGTA